MRKSAVEKIWEHNPCAWGEVLRRAKSICHWIQQGPSWLLWHPFKSHSSTEWFSWPGVLFLYQDHSLTSVGLRYRLYKQQTRQNSSASPRSRNPQTTRIKVHRPKKHCKRKRKHDEMRKPAEHNTDIKLRWETCCCLWQSSKTEFPNATGCSWKQLLVWFLPPVPFQTDYTPTEQQPGVLRQGRFLLSYTNHADSLQDLRAGIFIWGDRRRNSSHKEHWYQSQLMSNCVCLQPLCNTPRAQWVLARHSAEHNQLTAATQAVNQTRAVSRPRPGHPPQPLAKNITGLGKAHMEKYCLPLVQNRSCIIVIAYKRTQERASCSSTDRLSPPLVKLYNFNVG